MGSMGHVAALSEILRFLGWEASFPSAVCAVPKSGVRGAQVRCARCALGSVRFCRDRRALFGGLRHGFHATFCRSQ